MAGFLLEPLFCSGFEEGGTASPPLHQKPDASIPEGNSSAHQSGCDLVNVGGNITGTLHTHPITLMTDTSESMNQTKELTDEELEKVSGGCIDSRQKRKGDCSQYMNTPFEFRMRI